MQKFFLKMKSLNYTEKNRSRSIGYDVIEILEGDRTFMTIYTVLKFGIYFLQCHF